MNQSTELHVIFGTGPVGTTIARQLINQGKQVRAVNRSGKANLPAEVALIKGDAMDPATVRELSQGASVVYNCTHAPYYEWSQILPRLQQNMIEGAASTAAKLVVIDTLYMYGNTHGQVMTETSPHSATTRKGQFRAEIVRKYLQAQREGKIRVAIGRAADFFGPEVLNSSLGDRVFPQALAGQAVSILGNPNLIHSFSYMPDIAAGLIALGQHEEALGREWHLPTIADKTPRQIIDLVSEQLGKPLKIKAIPKIFIRAAGLRDPFMREYVELFYQHTEPQIVDSSAIERAFGITTTPLAEALTKTIEWYQKHDKVGKIGA
jgi:nucleoside-diphosphate-sugar epimerase